VKEGEGKDQKKKELKGAPRQILLSRDSQREGNGA